MNRLCHIRETLPVNILDNIGYHDIEFVLLDYNSADNLGEWVRSNMMKYIEAGILKYYRTNEPKYFDISHSKNMASKLATGNILCMIDADNFAGQNYANWIDTVFTGKGLNSIVKASESDIFESGDLGGKISCHRDLFNLVHGFDESFTGYGMDDVDLVQRLEKAGGIKVYISSREHLRYIRHSTEDRLKNYSLLNSLVDMYVQIMINGRIKKASVLYLMDDDTFCKATYEFDNSICSDSALSMQGWYAEKGGYIKGGVQKVEDGIILTDRESVKYKEEGDGLLVLTSGGKASSTLLQMGTLSPDPATLSVLPYSLRRIAYLPGAPIYGLGHSVHT